MYIVFINIRNKDNINLRKGEKNRMKKKKIVAISIIAVLVVAILLASYMLIIMTKRGEGVTAEEIAKVEEGEKLEAGTVSTADWNQERVNIVNDTENIPIPVPKGYTASSVTGEHTVNTGFVIYEGEEAVTDSNKADAQKTRNQWVWVPVENTSEIYGTDSQGKKHGKLYEFGSAGRSNYGWRETDGVMIDGSSDREPDVVYNDTDGKLPNYLSEETRKELYKEMQNEFEQTIESIEKYGGFYIGRYETGGLSGEAKVVKGDTDISIQIWYTMYEKSKELKGNNSNVRTSMIWGCQWDATLQWLVQSGSKTYEEVGLDSRSWGNCADSTVSGKGVKRPTGYSEVWKANNIYDMAGNVADFTLESRSLDYRVNRGGYYNNYYWAATADWRTNHDPYTTYDNKYGCRSMLYVNI